MVKQHHKHAESRCRIRLEYYPFKLLYYIIRLLPLPSAYGVARFIGRLLYRVDFIHRRRTVEHILHAGAATDVKAARKMARRVFEQFSMLLIEIFKADQCFDVGRVHLMGDPETIRRCFPREGRPAEENCIIVTAHYGNWEIAGGAMAQMTGYPLVSLMRPFSNPLIGETILRNRRTPTHEVLDKSGGIRGVMKALRTHKNIALLIDQHAAESEGVENVFFGQPCRTHTSPALLHLKTGIPIMPEVTRRLPGDRFEFEMEVGPLIDYKPTGDTAKDVQLLTQMCTDALEKLIRREPEQWLWAHRRWLNINRKHYDAQGKKIK